MARPIKDLTGQRFGALTAIEQAKTKKSYYIRWKCVCDCGEEEEFDSGVLTQMLKNKIPRRCTHLYKPGSKFGMLTILKDTGNRTGNGSIIWECQCDCGNVLISASSNFKSGKTHCGCQEMESGEGAFRCVYRNYKNSAKNRGLEFALSMDDIKRLTKLDCFYCGHPPATVLSYKHSTGDYIYNGIDRIDSNKGYTLENCVPCCTQCNKAKMDHEIEAFIAWINRAYHNLNKNGHFD